MPVRIIAASMAAGMSQRLSFTKRRCGPLPPSMLSCRCTRPAIHGEVQSALFSCGINPHAVALQQESTLSGAPAFEHMSSGSRHCLPAASRAALAQGRNCCAGYVTAPDSLEEGGAEERRHQTLTTKQKSLAQLSLTPAHAQQPAAASWCRCHCQQQILLPANNASHCRWHCLSSLKRETQHMRCSAAAARVTEWHAHTAPVRFNEMLGMHLQDGKIAQPHDGKRTAICITSAPMHDIAGDQ